MSDFLDRMDNIIGNPSRKVVIDHTDESSRNSLKAIKKEANPENRKSWGEMIAGLSTIVAMGGEYFGWEKISKIVSEQAPKVAEFLSKPIPGIETPHLDVTGEIVKLVPEAAQIAQYGEKIWHSMNAAGRELAGVVHASGLPVTEMVVVAGTAVLGEIAVKKFREAREEKMRSDRKAVHRATTG